MKKNKDAKAETPLLRRNEMKYRPMNKVIVILADTMDERVAINIGAGDDREFEEQIKEIALKIRRQQLRKNLDIQTIRTEIIKRKKTTLGRIEQNKDQVIKDKHEEYKLKRSSKVIV